MSDNLLSLLDRPIAFHRRFVPVAGGVAGAVFLSQAVYWSRRTTPDGWFFKTGEEWAEETGLSRREQEAARKTLKSAGVLEEVLKGIPAKLHYRLNLDVLADKLDCTERTNQFVQSVQTGMADPYKLYTETTAETTSEDLAPTVHSRLAAPRRPAVPVEEIVALYHQALPMCPQVRKLTTARRAQIEARWRGGDLPDLDTWRNYFEFCAESKFLTGLAPAGNGHKVFIADLEWLTREGNYAKVYERKYHR